MDLNEIELVLKHHQREIDNIKDAISRLMIKTSDWITPNQAAKTAGSRYSAHEIKRIVDRAIDNPLDTVLVDGVHYNRIYTGTQFRYKVNWTLMSQLV